MSIILLCMILMTRTCEFILATPVPLKCKKGRRGRARMVVGFIATYAISTYHPSCCEFESRSGRGVQHYEMKLSMTCDRSVASRGPPVSSTNKTDRHDKTEILLKVALNTINQTCIN